MQKLFGEYYVKELSNKEFSGVWKKYNRIVFTGPSMPDAPAISNEKKKKTLMRNMASMHRLNLGIYHNKNIIGWMWGKQINYDTFLMVNTGILPKYQGKGIYTALLKKFMLMLENMGYEVVKSHHYINNNRILLAKLKQGFVITGFEVSEHFGTIVNLTCFFNKRRKQLYESRTGNILS